MPPRPPLGWFIWSAKSIPDGAAGHCEVQSMKGTSMASPTTAGNALLVRQYFMEGYYPTGAAVSGNTFIPSGALIKAVLIHSGKNMDYATYVDSNGVAYRNSTRGYPSNIQGYGKIRLNSVLNFGVSTLNPISLFVVGAASTSSPHYASLTSLSDSDTYTFTTSADTNQPIIRVTLAYTDAVGTVGASVILVNDLTLTVKSPTETFQPLNSATSHIDNVEMVQIDTPTPSTTYTVKVSATTLSSTQDYALGMCY